MRKANIQMKSVHDCGVLGSFGAIERARVQQKRCIERRQMPAFLVTSDAAGAGLLVWFRRII